MTGGLCDDDTLPIGPEDPGVYAFSYPLTLPLSLLLCCYFLYKVRECYESSKTMMRATAMYVILALCLELSHTWNYFLRPVARSNTPLGFCATMEFCGWMLAVGSVVGLQQVLLFKLKVIFAATLYEVRQSVVRCWNAFHCVLLLIALAIFLANSSVVQCKRKLLLEGWAVSIGLYPKEMTVCAADTDNYYWISYYWLIFAGVCLLIGNAVLGWMYATRVQGALGVGTRKSISAREIRMAKKASVIALASITTTCVALLGFAFGKILIHVDVLLNVYFLFCQFSFAQAFYDATLAHCEITVDWLQPKQIHPMKAMDNIIMDQAIEVELSHNRQPAAQTQDTQDTS